MVDVSAFGSRVNIIASTTFPQGIEITAFADDADAVDSPSLQIADKAMGINGDLITWSKANPIPFTLNVIPNSDDDANLQVLAKANRAARGRRPVRDEITLIYTRGDGVVTQYLSGKLTDSMIGDSAASSGRLKTKAYVFTFEDAI